MFDDFNGENEDVVQCSGARVELTVDEEMELDQEMGGFETRNKQN